MIERWPLWVLGLVAVVCGALPLQAQTVRVEIEGGVTLPVAEGYVFRPSGFARQPPLVSTFDPAAVSFAASTRVIAGPLLGARVVAGVQRNGHVEQTYPRPANNLFDFTSYTRRSDVSMGARSVVIQPTVDIGRFGRFRPWAAAGLGLWWFREQQTNEQVSWATGALSSATESRDSRDETFVVSGGTRLVLSPRVFAGGEVNWHLKRDTQSSYGQSVSPRLPRFAATVTLGAAF